MSDDDEIEEPLTAADLDEIARSMVACEDIWLKAVAQATPAVQCPECGGRGETSQGSLGSYCATCDGSGVIEDEMDERPRLELPAGMRELKRQYLVLRADNTGATHAGGQKLLADIKALAKEAAPAYRKIVTDPRDKQIALLERRIEQLEQAQLPTPATDSSE